MRCENCGAAVPRDAGACPECGVFARVLPQKRRDRSRVWILGFLLIAAAIAAATYFATRGTKPPVVNSIRVVRDRPGGARVGGGAKVTEPEAMRRLVRHLNLKPDCAAVLSHGYREGAYDLSAVNRCEGTKLGRWRVDGKSGSVSRRRVG